MKAVLSFIKGKESALEVFMVGYTAEQSDVLVNLLQQLSPDENDVTNGNANAQAQN